MSNFVAEFMIVYETMTLRELLQSVDAEAYASIPLYDELLKTKPEYGSDNRIEVKVLNGEIAVSNVHIGSLGDIVACPIDVTPDLQVKRCSCWMRFSKKCPMRDSPKLMLKTSGMT